MGILVRGHSRDVMKTVQPLRLSKHGDHDQSTHAPHRQGRVAVESEKVPGVYEEVKPIPGTDHVDAGTLKPGDYFYVHKQPYPFKVVRETEQGLEVEEMTPSPLARGGIVAWDNKTAVQLIHERNAAGRKLLTQARELERIRERRGGLIGPSAEALQATREQQKKFDWPFGNVQKHGDHDQSTHGRRDGTGSEERPATGGKTRRANIQIGLRERADILRNRVKSDIAESRPKGRLSEMAEALLISNPGAASRIDGDVVGTPLGTLVYPKGKAPAAEQVRQWSERWSESEQLERQALDYNYAIIGENRTIGNRSVMEQGRKLREQGLLDADELAFQARLEEFWEKHPDADSGTVRGGTIEPWRNPYKKKAAGSAGLSKGSGSAGGSQVIETLRSLVGCLQQGKRQAHFEK